MADITGQDLYNEALKGRENTGSDLSGLSQEEITQKKYNTGQQYADAVSSFNKGDIVDKMRLKTGGVADLDKSIGELQNAYNASRPQLMKKYASVIDPVKRESLISAEQQGLQNQISDLNATRNYRLGQIKDLTDAEISSQENKLKGLEAQYKLYSDVLGDKVNAEKIKIEMLKTAQDLNKGELDIKATEEKYGLIKKPNTISYGQTDFTPLAEQYKGASFKNNNPSNIKFNPNGFNKVLDQYGIDYTEGTGATDGGKFIKFNSIEDGLTARYLLLYKTGVYPELNVEQAMRRWSNGGYGAEILPGVNPNTKIKDLSESQKQQLLVNQLKGEDRNMYNSIIQYGIKLNPIEEKGGYVKKETPEGGLKKADGTYDYTKIGDLKTYNEVQDNSADDIGKKITVGNAKKIVKEDMAGKFELGADSEIVKKAGLENDYSDNAIVYDLKNTSDNDDTLDYIEQLVTLNKGNEKYIEDLIKKSGLIKKEGWKPGTFNDDKYYDKLQKLGLFK